MPNQTLFSHAGAIIENQQANNLTMLISYLKIALRSFLKNKVHTSINLLGLALGMASVLIISLYIKHELSYDRFHDGSENIYRITWESNNSQTRTPHPMAQALVQDFPEVESAVTLTPLFGSGLTRETHSFRNLERDERFDEANILAVDTTFFNVFSFPLVKGNPKTVLKHVNGLLISESMAKKYFGDEDPMGKHLAVDSDSLLVEIVGVFKDVPEQSHFHFDFLVSYVREKAFDGEDKFYTWSDFGHYNYIRLVPGTDAKKLEGQLMEWARKYLDVTDEQMDLFTNSGYGFRLQPMAYIHLHSRLRWELEPNGNIDYIYILGAAAILTLIIACVNFVNLTTSKSAERTKEIGIRKSLGAFRKQLASQFIMEAVLLASGAVALSIIIVEISLPFFNSLANTKLEIEYPQYLLLIAALGGVIGLVAGFYPSFYLSSIKPSLILKGTTELGRTTGLRNGLIVFQFAMSMALISGSMVVYNQLGFLRNHDLGFGKEGILVIPVKNERLSDEFQTFRNELLKIKGVQSVSAASNIPGKQFNQNPIAAVQQPNDDLATSECFVDADFFSTMSITVKEGRSFSQNRITDSTKAFVLNETAVSQLNLTSAIGSEINWDRDPEMVRGEVIGVVKDFNFQSLHEPMRPLLFSLGDHFNFILIRTNLQNLREQISAIEKAYKQFDPIFAFEFSFLDDQLNQQYVGEERLGKVMAIFSFIAIAIASFGLFGMAMLSFFQRIKEIGIRKILGASSASLLYLLLKNFTLLILFACAIATPFTWLIMNRWLENFSYRITVGPWIFVSAGLLLIAMGWIILSYLTVKTTRLNPVDTLRSE